MGKIIINVDWDKNYGAVPANDGISVAVTGKTLDEIKERMEHSLRSHLSGLLADGDRVPAEFTGDFELEYHLNIRALLHFTEGIVPRKALSRATGINQQQLSHYATGWRHPKPEMQQRIVRGIHEIGEQLVAISL